MLRVHAATQRAHLPHPALPTRPWKCFLLLRSKMSSRRVPIPSGFQLGALFGKGGARIKEVQSRTGARVRIDGEGGYIELSGAPRAVSAAAAQYEEQFR